MNFFILNNHLSASELASLMERLIADEEHTLKMSQQAIETSSKFTWTKTLSSVISAYENVLARNETVN